MNCLECDAPITASTRGQPKRFCSPSCRQTFNNRRANRGAVLYDLFMANRFDRDRAYPAKVMSFMCRIAEEWNREDARRTWGDFADHMTARPDIAVGIRQPSMRTTK